MSATPTRGRTARKVLGSLAVLGAAAAVAGMGTFGSFTDSTVPLDASVSTGTLKIALTGQNASATLPTFTATNFVPGDSMSRPVDLINKGSLAMGSITLTSTATTSSLLTTDTTKGLQLTVASCPVAWTETTSGSGAWTCSSATTLVSGPAVTSVPLANAASANVDGTDRLLITVSLPVAADNTFQNKTGAISITFAGAQKTGTTR
jgi:Camelysin metallo-endopeptidase